MCSNFPHPSFAEKCTLPCIFSVELPGIEPAAKSMLAWGNVESDDAKALETT
jgi:hypothetical protein